MFMWVNQISMYPFPCICVWSQLWTGCQHRSSRRCFGTSKASCVGKRPRETTCLPYSFHGGNCIRYTVLLSVSNKLWILVRNRVPFIHLLWMDYYSIDLVFFCNSRSDTGLHLFYYSRLTYMWKISLYFLHICMLYIWLYDEFFTSQPRPIRIFLKKEQKHRGRYKIQPRLLYVI